MFPIRNLQLDKDGDDGGSTTATTDSSAEASTETTSTTQQSEPKIEKSTKPSDEVLSKIKFDVSDLDDDKSSAPSEKETYEGIFPKLPKLDLLKKQEQEEETEEGEATDKLDKFKESVGATGNESSESPTRESKRDYSKFPKELVPVLKHFNNQAFKWVEENLPVFDKQKVELDDTRKKLEDASKGLVKLPENYYESPQAFLLDPEFQKVSSNYDRASFEASHWEQQLARIESGEPFQRLLKYVDGQPVFGEPERATAELKIKVSSALNQAIAYQRDFQVQAQQLQQSFSQKHKEAANFVTDTMAKFIPWESDPKALETKLPGIGGKDGKTIKEFLQEHLELVPPQFRGNVMSRAWANVMIVNHMQSQKIAELEKALGVDKTNKEHQRGAQPGDGKSGGGANGSKGVSRKGLVKFNVEGMYD